MADTLVAIPKRIVAAAGMRRGQRLDGKRVTAEKAAFGVAVAAVIGPDWRRKHHHRCWRQEAAAIGQKQLPDFCQVARRNAQTALWRKERAIVAGTIASQVAATFSEDRAIGLFAAQVIPAHTAVGMIEHDRACHPCVAACRPVVAGIDVQWLENEPLHQTIKALARNTLHRTADDREIEV